jgi:hypothetical protein
MILYKNTSKVLYNYSMCMGGYVKDPSMGCVHRLNGMAIYCVHYCLLQIVQPI